MAWRPFQMLYTTSMALAIMIKVETVTITMRHKDFIFLIQFL